MLVVSSGKLVISLFGTHNIAHHIEGLFAAYGDVYTGFRVYGGFI